MLRGDADRIWRWPERDGEPDYFEPYELAPSRRSQPPVEPRPKPLCDMRSAADPLQTTIESGPLLESLLAALEQAIGD